MWDFQINKLYRDFSYKNLLFSFNFMLGENVLISTPLLTCAM